MELTVSRDSIVVAANHQVSCDLAGDAVILNLKTGVYYGLDAVGARIWNLIQAPMTVADIQDIVLKEYDVEAGRCEGDLLALLQELTAAELIEVHREGYA